MTRRKADCTPEEIEILRAKRREAKRRARERDPEAYRARQAAAMRQYRARNKEAKGDEWRAKKRAAAKKSWAVNEHYRMMRRAQKSRWRARFRNKRDADQLFTRVLALIPVQVEARYDIASETMIALLDGKALTVADAVALGRKTHYRQFSQFDKKTISLDAPLANGGSLHDIIAQEEAA